MSGYKSVVRATYPFPYAHPYKVMTDNELAGCRSQIWGKIHNKGCGAPQQNQKPEFYHGHCSYSTKGVPFEQNVRVSKAAEMLPSPPEPDRSMLVMVGLASVVVLGLCMYNRK